MTGAFADSPPLIEVRGLVKHFGVHRGILRRRVGTVRAVDGVSFSIGRGETLSLVGESGCGKTTVGRAMLRLIEPDAGAVELMGRDLRALGQEELRRARRQMQIIFQDPFSSLNPRHTVARIVGDPMLLHGKASRRDLVPRAASLLERVGLRAEHLGRYPHEFSGGQRQRIGIARAMATRPDFVVCDEAVSALDVSVQAQILNLLLDLQREHDLGYLFITHDLSLVRHISTAVAVMYLGEIVEFGPRESLFRSPLHPYTRTLLSAAPRSHPRQEKERAALMGDVPSPLAPPPGCRFHPRCPLSFDRCSHERPAARQVGPGHRVACHLYESEGETPPWTKERT